VKINYECRGSRVCVGGTCPRFLCARFLKVGRNRKKTRKNSQEKNLRVIFAPMEIRRPYTPACNQSIGLSPQ